MKTYYLRIRGKGTTWHKVEASTLSKAKHKLIEGSFYKNQPGILKDVLVRKSKP